MKHLSVRTNHLVCEDATIQEVIIEISRGRLGATVVCDIQNKIIGIITDGDLRRCFENNQDINKLNAKKIMTSNPKQIDSSSLAYDAFKIMKSNNITQLIVFEENKYFGVIHLHDIINEGIVQ